MFHKLTVIGVGLIGGSLIRALKESESVERVVGCSKSEQTLKTALKLNIIDFAEMDIAKAVSGADMVVIATPVGAMKSVFEQIIPVIGKATVVTDVGSTKTSVLADIKSVAGVVPNWFVPGHPVAGTENSGVAHSFETLFSNKRVILTPTKNTAQSAIDKVQKMWRIVGSKVSFMDCIEHDKILGATSHLPHILSYSLVNQLSETPKVFDYSGGGFRDFARIALSDPAMWRDICLANATQLSKLIKSYKKHLSDIEQSIENNDSIALFDLLKNAQKIRENI